MKVIKKRFILRDWRTPVEYEPLKKYPLDRWAWEFLRRNPKYITEWEKLTNDLTDDQKIIKRLSDSGCRKWWIKRWLDPFEEYSNIGFIGLGGEPVPLIFVEKTGHIIPFFKHAGNEDLRKIDGEIPFLFDIRNPIIPQIEKAKKFLLDLQKKRKGEKQNIFKPRTHKKIKQSRFAEWVSLLRILDALSSGAKMKTIAETFFNEGIGEDEIKVIYDKKIQALRYANHDYRFIPFLNE